jgi:adenosylhomocysteinase
MNEQELIESGRRRIAWSRAQMPILADIGSRFAGSKPFAGLTIGICLHVEAKTGVWIETLLKGGARIAITGSPGSTQDDTAAALAALPDVRVYSHSGETFDDHIRHCRLVLDAGPDLIADNGGDLHALIYGEDAHGALRKSLRGATEETTTGAFRLYEELQCRDFPTLVINDTQAKRVVENRYGVGSSVVDALMRATNIMLHGKRIVVIGYGYCGAGIAQRLRGMGAHVTVVDREPLSRLEAHLEGFSTDELPNALASAQVVITATGRSGVLDGEMIGLLRSGSIVANAGHFATEIDLAALVEAADAVVRVRDQIERYEMKDGRHVYLMSQGNLVNLTAGDGNPIEIMDLGLALQSLSLARLAQSASGLAKGAQAVPRDIEREVVERALAAWVTGRDTP